MQRKKKALVVLLSVLALAGCNLADFYNFPGFSHPEKFESEIAVLRWISTHISYSSRANDGYWQGVKETYDLRSGLCVDYCTLALYFLHEIGIDAEIAVVSGDQDGNHSIIRDIATGIYYDPQTTATWIPSKVIRTISYKEAMYAISCMHK